VSSLGNFFANLGIRGQATLATPSAESSQPAGAGAWGFEPDPVRLWMVNRWRPALRFNGDGGRSGGLEQQPLIPITNGYGYLDMAWIPARAIWAVAAAAPCYGQSRPGSQLGSGPVGPSSPPTFKPNRLTGNAKALFFGERGNMAALGSAASGGPCVTNQRLRAPRQRVAPRICSTDSPASPWAAGSTGETPLFRRSSTSIRYWVIHAVTCRAIFVGDVFLFGSTGLAY